MKFINPESKICCDEAIKCVFDLNQLDILVLKKLREKKQIRSDTLSKELKRERSTIYRSLQKLTNCGLCIKRTKTIKSGGYYHVYICNNNQQVRKNMQSCIDQWYQQMKEIINEIQ